MCTKRNHHADNSTALTTFASPGKGHMWHKKVIPHIQETESYCRQDVLELLKQLKIDRRLLPEAFLATVGWQNNDAPLSGTTLIAGLEAYKPTRGRRSLSKQDRKNISCQVRITEKEHCFIKLVAQIHSLTANQFIRARLLDEPLPDPLQGLNIEASHFLDRIAEDMRLAESLMRDGDIEPISLNTLSLIHEKIEHIQKAMRRMHQIQLQAPNSKDPRIKRIHLMLSPCEAEKLSIKRKNKNFSRYFRDKVFSRSDWLYCRKLSDNMFHFLKKCQWDLNQALTNIQVGSKQELRPPPKQVLVTLTTIEEYLK